MAILLLPPVDVVAVRTGLCFERAHFGPLRPWPRLVYTILALAEASIYYTSSILLTYCQWVGRPRIVRFDEKTKNRIHTASRAFVKEGSTVKAQMKTHL